MLTSPEIEEAKRRGLLFPVRPADAWTGKPRALLMCAPLKDDLDAGRVDADEKVRRRWAQVEAALIHFIENGRMTEKLIKQLKPEKFEHWEIICRRPRPSYRVFGRFALPDVFIATHVKLRNGLGGMHSPQFAQEMLVCEDHYRNAGLTTFFSDIPDFKYESYITENATAKIGIPR
jgi:hypothetical protein